MKNIIFTLATCLISIFSYAQQTNESKSTAVKPDTSFCEIYISLNDIDAIDYTFNLMLNDQHVAKIKNGTRMIYRIFSSGKVTISDNGHKPSIDFQAKHGSKFYFELSKKFGGRYFHIKNYNTDSEIQQYLHFIFWNGNSNSGIAPVLWQTVITTDSKDHRITIQAQEDLNHPICK